MHGQGKKAFVDGSFISGQFVGGTAHGVCTKRFPCGDVYIGNYKYDKRNGIGTYEWTDGSFYSGEWFNDRMHGDGRKIQRIRKSSARCSPRSGTPPHASAAAHIVCDPKYRDTIIEYQGDFRNDVFHGTGRAVFGDGSKYEGGFSCGAFCGWGRLESNSDGDIYEGDFLDGKKHGTGVMFYGGLYLESHEEAARPAEHFHDFVTEPASPVACYDVPESYQGEW